MSADPVIVKARAGRLDEYAMTMSKDEKAARLAAQLRANLKRRKDQARGSAAAPVTKPDDGADERD